MHVAEDIMDVQTPDGPMAVLRKRPRDHVARRRVVMFHDGPGIRGATHEFARKLAGASYDVTVPDLYHRHGRMIGYELAEREADPTLVDQLWTLVRSLDDQEIQDDLDGVLRHLEIPAHEPLATIGFCLGARAVFRTMMRLPERFVAGAMWHPSYLVDDDPTSPHLTAHELHGALFVGLGGADEMQPVEIQQPFLDAISSLDDTEVRVYPNAGHGYTWPGWPNYNKAASDDSFRQTNAAFARDAQSTTSASR